MKELRAVHHRFHGLWSVFLVLVIHHHCTCFMVCEVFFLFWSFTTTVHVSWFVKCFSCFGHSPPLYMFHGLWSVFLVLVIHHHCTCFMVCEVFFLFWSFTTTVHVSWFVKCFSCFGHSPPLYMFHGLWSVFLVLVIHHHCTCFMVCEVFFLYWSFTTTVHVHGLWSVFLVLVIHHHCTCFMVCEVFFLFWSFTTTVHVSWFVKCFSCFGRSPPLYMFHGLWSVFLVLVIHHHCTCFMVCEVFFLFWSFTTTVHVSWFVKCFSCIGHSPPLYMFHGLWSVFLVLVIHHHCTCFMVCEVFFLYWSFTTTVHVSWFVKCFSCFGHSPPLYMFHGLWSVFLVLVIHHHCTCFMVCEVFFLFWSFTTTVHVSWFVKCFSCFGHSPPLYMFHGLWSVFLVLVIHHHCTCFMVCEVFFLFWSFTTTVHVSWFVKCFSCFGHSPPLYMFHGLWSVFLVLVIHHHCTCFMVCEVFFLFWSFTTTVHVSWFVKCFSCFGHSPPLYMFHGLWSVFLVLVIHHHCTCFMVCEVIFLFWSFTTTVHVSWFVKCFSCFGHSPPLYMFHGLWSVFLVLVIHHHCTCFMVCEVFFLFWSFTTTVHVSWFVKCFSCIGHSPPLYMFHGLWSVFLVLVIHHHCTCFMVCEVFFLYWSFTTTVHVSWFVKCFSCIGHSPPLYMFHGLWSVFLVLVIHHHCTCFMVCEVFFLFWSFTTTVHVSWFVKCFSCFGHSPPLYMFHTLWSNEYGVLSKYFEYNLVDYHNINCFLSDTFWTSGLTTTYLTSKTYC